MIIDENTTDDELHDRVDTILLSIKNTSLSAIQEQELLQIGFFLTNRVMTNLEYIFDNIKRTRLLKEA